MAASDLAAHRPSIDIARGASLPALERSGRRKRFLVAVDGSTSSLSALMHAAELCKEGDEITILTISFKPAGHVSVVYQSADAVLAQAERVLKENYKQPPKYRVCISANPSPAKEIVEFARKEQADYIVMGTRGLSGVRRLARGSVSDYVTRNAGCPVLIVRSESDIKG